MFIGVEEKFPFVPQKQVQPASIDLRLSNRITKFKNDILEFDLKNIEAINQFLDTKFLEVGEAFSIEPHEIIFSQVYEQMYIGNNLSARIEGRSRMARLGMSVHTTGDYINPGFIGAMPLQIINNNHFPITLYPYMSICQIMLYKLTGEPLVKYADKANLPWNKYQNEIHASPSIISIDPIAEIMDHGTIMEKKISSLVEDYYQKMERNGWATERNTSKVVSQYINNINYMEVHMRDQYNANQVGIQGYKAGDHATIIQNSTPNDIDYTQMIKEIGLIKKYLKNNNTEDEHDVLIGEITKLSKAIDEKDERNINSIISSFGHQIGDIAKSIGCSVVARYISSLIGF